MSKSSQRIVIILSVSIFVQFLGAMAISPILPIFLKHASQKEYSIGLIIGLFFAFNLLAQYPTGKYVDKHSPIVTIVAGLTIFVLGSIFMGLANNFISLIVFRSIQGVGSGAFMVSTNSLVAKTSTNDEKTKAFAYIFGAQMSGTTIGALLGSTFGLTHLRQTFFLAAGLSLISLIFTLFNLKLIKDSHIQSESKANLILKDTDQSLINPTAKRHSMLFKNPAVYGAICWAIASGSISGVYETLWSPYFISRGGSGLMLGLSWFCFGAPYILFSWKIDKIFKHLKLTSLALTQPIFGGIFIFVYAILKNVDIIVIFCAVEAILILPGSPAIQTILTRSIRFHDQGRAQGLILSFQIATQAIFAFASGLLASKSIYLSFYAGGIFSVLLAVPMAIYIKSAVKTNSSHP